MTERMLEYKSLVYKANLIINNVEKMGINVSDYITKLNEIDKDFEGELNRSANISNVFLEQYCLLAINKLNLLINELRIYNIYFTVINKVNYINASIQINCTSEEVNEYVDDLLNILDNMINSSNYNFDVYEKVMDKIFNVVYKVIKLEIINNGESILFDYCKKYHIYVYFIDKYIKKEINKIDLSDKKYKKLNKKIYDINSKGIEQSYFDLAMVKLLLSYENSFSIGDTVNNKFKNILTEIDDCYIEFDDKIKDLNDKNSELQKNNSMRRYIKKELLIRLSSVVLTTSIIVGGFVGIRHGVKKANTHEGVKREVTTYSDEFGLNVNSEYVNLETVGDFEGKKYLRIYGVWEEDKNNLGIFNRTVDRCNISGYEFDTIEDYINYGVDNYDIIYETIVETKKFTEIEKNYNKSYAEVEVNTIDRNDTAPYFDKDTYTLIVSSVYFIYIICLFAVFSVFQITDCLVWTSYFDVFYYFGEYLTCGKISSKQLEEMKSKLNEILKIINKNDEIRLEFNKLYEENKYLLDDPEELYKRFNDISSKINTNNSDLMEVKKLVRNK